MSNWLSAAAVTIAVLVAAAASPAEAQLLGVNTIASTTTVTDPFRSATFALVEQPAPTATPEPATLALFATGLLGLGLHRYRRRQGNPATPA